MAQEFRETRARGTRELEEEVLNQLVGLGDLERIAKGMINRDHPAMLWSDERGTFMVTVEKVSNAHLRKITDVDQG